LTSLKGKKPSYTLKKFEEVDEEIDRKSEDLKARINSELGQFKGKIWVN
jgi:hypothetical protein